MNIHEIPTRIKGFVGQKVASNTEVMEFDEEGKVVRHSPWDKFFLAICIILVATLSFGLGRLSKPSRAGVTLEEDLSLAAALTPAREIASSTLNTKVQKAEAKTAGSVFASSKGKRYYYPGCTNTISEKNKINFGSAALAEAAGYTIAANCSPR